MTLDTGISPAQCRQAFPFHFVLDRLLHVVQCGQALEKLLPDLAAVPALALVAVGLLPVMLLIRLTTRR